MVDFINFYNFSHYTGALSELRTLWEEVHNTQTLQIAVVVGESGSNKTGLVEEFLRRHRAVCVRSRGVQIPGSYLPLQLAYESILRMEIVQKQIQRPWQDVSPEWQTFLSTFHIATPMLHLTTSPQAQPLELNIDESLELQAKDGQADPASLPEHFTTVLGELAGLIPLVFFVDDVDQTDAYTRDALARNIIPQLHETPILCIFSLESISAEFLDQLPPHSTLPLPPLRRDEIEQLVSKQFPELLASGRSMVVEHLAKVTEGRLASIQDIIQWITKQNEAVILANPEAISNNEVLLKAQFENLKPNEQETLQMAACQGRYFSVGVLAQALSKPVVHLSRSLNRLADSLNWTRFDAKISSKERVFTWHTFQARIYYNTVYDSIPADKRSAYHRRVAYALEQMYENNTAAVAGQLAWQFEQGAIIEKAAQYQAEMAHQANNQGNLDQALTYAEKGLDSLGPVEELKPVRMPLACKLLIEQGRALQGTERSHAAIDILQDALNLAEYLEDDQALQTQAHLYLGTALLNRNRLEESVRQLSTALEMAARRKDWGLVTKAIDNLRIQYSRRGQARLFFALCDQMTGTMQGEESARAQVALAEILAAKSWLHHQRGEQAAALTAIEQAFAQLAGLKQYPEIHYRLHHLQTRILRSSKDYTGALAQAESTLRWADASRLRRNQARAQIAKAATLHAMGRIDQAGREYEAALALLKHSSTLGTLALVEQSYGQFMADTGHILIARQLYQRAYDHASRGSNFYRMQSAMNGLASMNKALGYFNEALAEYKQLLNQAVSQDDKARQSTSLNHIGDIYRILNRFGEAKRSHMQAVRLADALEQQTLKVQASIHLGRTYLASWEIGQAAETFGTIGADLPQRAAIFLGRLALCRNAPDAAAQHLDNIVKHLEESQDLTRAGTANLNKSLLLLLSGDAAGALATAQRALAQLDETGGWRVADAYHLLARCHLAQGDLRQAQSEIDRANRKFTGLDLFHRVHQVENTELQIEEAHETGNARRWAKLAPNELRFVFNHLGI